MNKNEKKEAKLRQKEAKEMEKQEKIRKKEIIREEKERVRNSFFYKLKNFIFTFIFVVILLCLAFLGLKYYITERNNELNKEEYEYYYSEGEKYLADKKYEEAIVMFSKIDESSEKYDDAKEKINEATEKYLDEYIENAERLIGIKHFDEAEDLFSDLSEDILKTDKVKEILAKIATERIRDSISNLQSNYDILIKIDDMIPDDADVNVEKAIDDLVYEYMDLYIEEVTKNVSTRNYEIYLKEIDTLLEKYDNDEKLVDLKDLVSSYIPQDVTLLPYEVESDVEVSGENAKISDIKKKEYTSYILAKETKNAESRKISFELDKKYSRFSGTIALNSAVKKFSNNEVKVSIIGDGNVLYKSKGIKKDMNSFNFDVDVKDVQKLEIVFETNSGISYFIGSPLLTK